MDRCTIDERTRNHDNRNASLKSSPIVTESAVFTEPSTATRYIHGQVAERIGIGIVRQMMDIRTKQFLRR